MLCRGRPRHVEGGSAKGSVHAGLRYTRLAKSIIESATTTAKKLLDTADCSVAGVKQSFYWRGFCSVRGGTRTAHSATSYKARASQSGSRGGSSSAGFHPYRGGGGTGL